MGGASGASELPQAHRKTHHSRIATVTRAPLYCGGLADRPIIRLQLPGDTVDEFQRAAALQLGREFFVELDAPAIEHVRIEAPFKSGAIAVRAEAVTKAATREGRIGALFRLIKLEPASYGVPIPPGSAWPAPEDVTEVRLKPDGPVIARTTTPVAKAAVARTATPHVVRRVIEVEVDDPAAEFGASITKSSPVSADLAKQLGERPTPPPAVSVPKTAAIIRRQTPVAGIPAIPKPVEKKIAPPPSVPPLDDEWTFDAPTLGPATKATVAAKPKPSPPAMPAAKKPPPTPAKGVPSVKQPLDDDAAFDDAFGMLEDDLSIHVEPPPKAPERPTPAAVVRVADEITKPVVAPEIPKLAERPTPPAPIARTADEITKPVANPAALLRATSEPGPATPGSPTEPQVEAKPGRIPMDPPVEATPKTQRLPTDPPAAKHRASEPAILGAKPRLSTQPPLDQDEIPTFDPAKPTKRSSSPVLTKPDFAEPPKPDEVTRPMPPSAIAELAAAPVARPSSEGVLATARASELAMTGTSELELVDATSTGAIGSTRPASEALRPRSKLPLILGVVAALAGVIVVVVLASGGGTTSDPKTPPTKPTSSKAEVDKHLREAASRIADGKLVGVGGDAALDHLLAAKAIAPGDPQVVAQLKALADTFERLGDGAMAANDLAEAATHYQAALTAEPDRASAKSKLADVENRARGR